MMQLIRLAAPNTTRWGIRGDEERNKSDLARNLEAKKRDHAVFKEKNSTSGDEIKSLEDETIYKPVRRTIGRLRGGVERYGEGFQIHRERVSRYHGTKINAFARRKKNRSRLIRRAKADGSF